MKLLKRITLIALSLCMLAAYSISDIVAAAGVVRPYVFGFGSASDGSEGTQALIKAGDMQQLTFTDSTGYQITYWAHIPKDEQGKPIENLPVVVYLHGYSDGGANTDTAIRMHNGVLYQLIKEQNDANKQAIVLAPQTPYAMNPAGESDWFKDQWVGIKGNDKWSQWSRTHWSMDETPRTNNLNAVVELVKAVQENTSSDKDRAYVTGISMGGYATWDLITRDDEHLFAAAVPICGVGDVTKVENVKDIPIRTFHGAVDSTIPASATREMYQALRKFGNITFTEYADENHLSWNSAYSNTLDDDKNGKSNIEDLVDWMFNQSRQGTLDGSIDKEPLRFVIRDAKAERASSYKTQDWENLQNEITEAEQVLENKEASEQEVKKEIRKLDLLIECKTTSDASNNQHDISLSNITVTSPSEMISDQNEVIRAVDGDVNTIWHTNYTTDAKSADKHYITFESPEEMTINGLRYLPRQVGVNGIITEYEIYAGNDVNNLTLITTGTWGLNKDWKLTQFPEIHAKYVRLKSKKAGSDIPGSLFASAAEVRLTYKESQDVNKGKDDVLSLYNELKLLSSYDYTQESFKALQDVLVEVNDFLQLQIPDGSLYGPYYELLATANENLVKEVKSSVWRTILQNSIKKAEGYNDVLHTLAPKVATMIRLRLSEAKIVYEDETSSDESYQTAWLNLANALQYVEFVADKTELKLLIDECDQIDVDQYVSGVEIFKAVLANAHTVYDNADVLQETINDVYSKLLIAKQGLINDHTDIIVLQQMMDDIQTAIGDGTNYRHDQNWQLFQTALANAQIVLQDENAAAENITNAITQLALTYENIRLLPNESLLAELKTFVNMVRSLDLTYFNGDDITFIQNVQKRAEAMLKDLDHFDDVAYPVLQKDIQIVYEKVEQNKTEQSTDDKKNPSFSIEKETPEIQNKATIQKKNEVTKGVVTGDSTDIVRITGLLFLSGIAGLCARRRYKKSNM